MHQSDPSIRCLKKAYHTERKTTVKISEDHCSDYIIRILSVVYQRRRSQDVIRMWLPLFRGLYEPFLLLKTIEVSEYGSYPITTNKGRDTISFVLRKALEEIHSIHIINETLIRFHDVPELNGIRKSYHTRKWKQ